MKKKFLAILCIAALALVGLILNLGAGRAKAGGGFDVIRAALGYTMAQLKAVNICTVVGFPLGYQTTAAKVCEVEQAIADAAVFPAGLAMCWPWQVPLWGLVISGVFPIWLQNTAAGFSCWFFSPKRKVQLRPNA